MGRGEEKSIKACNHTEGLIRTSSRIGGGGGLLKVGGCMGWGEEKSIKACSHTEGSIRTSSHIGGGGVVFKGWRLHE